ncbi:MAG: hypothetical protein P0Y55_07155 [Candidatus Cohnella colombiensis]|uniref:Methyltransferase n=1 Tax=Candidatus Cohnella colombiensis TaxID=3121368 RepID=A0AA95EZI4_9BACL|nr:MAG: hypothetical protein P0Y55_07155 [Cohnella sp.]
MARSWERMVLKNSKQINKRRKKEGKQSLSKSSPAKVADRFQGRSYIVPTILILFIVLYVLLAQPWSDAFMPNRTLFWATVGAYLVLALFYFMRRPYLSVTRDTLETRKLTGYKTLRPGEIRKFVIQPGYVIVESVKGTNWVFSRVMNRYPIDRMAERLKVYADLHHVEWEVKSK